MTIPVAANPFFQPAAWNTITVGFVSWPYKFDIHQDTGREHKWQVKDAPGVEGATTTYRGKKPIHFGITFFAHDATSFMVWEVMQEQFLYRGVIGQVLPIGISHPSLALVQITQVEVVHLGVMRKVGDDLMYSATVKFQEFFPPPPVPLNATVTPIAAAPPAGAGHVPNPQAAALQTELNGLKSNANASGAPGGMR